VREDKGDYFRSADLVLLCPGKGRKRKGGKKVEVETSTLDLQRREKWDFCP